MTSLAASPLSAGAGAAAERRVAVPGGSVWVGSSGGGPGLPLLVLHGGPGSTHDYLGSLAALGGERTVIFYDQLGCGRSDRPADPTLWRLDRFVRELALVQEALGLPRVHLLGHSWGTMLGLDYALQQRERAASLTLVSPCLSMARVQRDMERHKQALPPSIRQTIETHEARGAFDSGMYRAATRYFYQQHVCRLAEWPEALTRSQAAFSWQVYRTMWGPSELTVTGNLASYEREHRLRELAVPVLYACGRHDEITPESTAAYHRLTPGSRLEVFDASAHLPNLEEPQRFVDVVGGFLRDADADADSAAAAGGA